ncbi:MA3 DOMAIN-CONTAINING TRANSLATION REGULATORY FACTOR 1-like [Zingiber officinale]|uniref:MA3 DOMAIN-CONTAINING TRANSLATION REGULATORY FACTOR 1-like n=1 Tax=Zingiber officinale TaxID=94328 RepID=UPI001C4C7539|nr:MA3 DOMAIN-CONTAINING TRANSLATION REGULATORY FACTOR 1-like [Zingiber officinale]
MASPKEEGFLTEEQREVMRIAAQNAEIVSPRSWSSLLAPEIKSKAVGGGKGSSVGGGGAKHVRRSHSGKALRAKKDGAGGKGTWGKLLDTETDSCLDRNDPNYESEEELYELVAATVSDPVDNYKKSVVTIIEEYFNTGDVQLAATDLRELGSDKYHHFFVKKLISMAMDRHDKEKEMASVLLSSLYADVTSPAQISQGFVMLLDSVDDLTVDIPDAVDVLALFVARAVVDDILPPAFLTRVKRSLNESSKAFQVIQIAEKSYLSAPHHAELVEQRWGGTIHITVEEVKKKITDLLREYIESGDTTEACRCIRELGVSFFHHEVVKRALILAMEIQTSEPSILILLKEAAEECLISTSQMVKGFSRLADSLDDLSLDIPTAKSLFEVIVSKAISEGWLDPSFLKSKDVFEDCTDEEHMKLKRYKEEIVTTIHEYFLSGDESDLTQSLRDLAAPDYNPIFIKKLITLSMERKNREREMASVLLSTLSMGMFSRDDIVKGFIMLLESAEDTALDILDASNELALFLARAVIDDVLAPLNLEEISNKLPPNCSGSETVHMARSLISARYAGERLLRCWGGGTGLAVEDAKDKITKLLEEYESGGDVGEACQCIRDLGMPFFNHEVVKKALIMAMEKKSDRVLDFLQECFCEGLITTNQMTKGFSRVKDGLDDLALDIPNAQAKLQTYLDHAKKQGWLLMSF